MKPAQNVIQTIQASSAEDIKAALTNVISSIQSGKVLEDPNMLMALALLAAAGLILTVCLFVVFFKKSNNPLDFANIYSLESRMHTLEVTIHEQKALIANLKAQQKADFLYVKQELNTLEHAVADFGALSFDSSPTIAAAANCKSL